MDWKGWSSCNTKNIKSAEYQEKLKKRHEKLLDYKKQEENKSKGQLSPDSSDQNLSDESESEDERSKKFGQAEYRKRMRETESERCEAKAKMLKVMESASRANITPEKFSHVYNDILVKEGKITENEQNMVMYKSKAVRLQKN